MVNARNRARKWKREQKKIHLPIEDRSSEREGEKSGSVRSSNVAGKEVGPNSVARKERSLVLPGVETDPRD